jgi:succinate-semialdehyde dehydrogenase/glutarate-semialdehyde dehydrogenase/succinyl-CoA reductase
LFIKKASQLKVGDPTSTETDIGPLSSKDGLETISGIVEDAKNKGAEILLGGSEIDRKGYFFQPTILTGVKSNMRIAKEETFGPVAPITIVDSESEAIRLANDTEFGLGASIWTKDLAKAEKMSRRIESGIVSVNNVVLSDPRIPFGGIKHSGFGRELSRYGVLEFVNIKSVRFYDNLSHHHYVE